MEKHTKIFTIIQAIGWAGGIVMLLTSVYMAITIGSIKTIDPQQVDSAIRSSVPIVNSVLEDVIRTTRVKIIMIGVLGSILSLSLTLLLHYLKNTEHVVVYEYRSLPKGRLTILDQTAWRKKVSGLARGHQGKVCFFNVFLNSLLHDDSFEALWTQMQYGRYFSHGRTRRSNLQVNLLLDPLGWSLWEHEAGIQRKKLQLSSLNIASKQIDQTVGRIRAFWSHGLLCKNIPIATTANEDNPTTSINTHENNTTTPVATHEDIETLPFSYLMFRTDGDKSMEGFLFIHEEPFVTIPGENERVIVNNRAYLIPRATQIFYFNNKSDHAFCKQLAEMFDAYWG
jgi:hypothetical protein